MELEIKIDTSQVERLLERLPREVVLRGFFKALDAADLVVENELEKVEPHLTGEMSAERKHRTVVDYEGRGGLVNIGYGDQTYKARLVSRGHRMLSHRPQRKFIKNVAGTHFVDNAFAAAAGPATEAFYAALEEALRESGQDLGFI